MKYKDYNDYELIYMVREKDDFSKDVLFEKYNPIINKIVLEFFNNYSNYGYDYDDFYQEAILAFDRAIVTYNEDKDTLFYTFLVICIKRALLSFTRNISNKNKNISNVFYVNIDDYNLMDKKSDIENILDNYENERILKEIIYDPTLLIEDTSILELRMNAFTYGEIEILLDIPISTLQFKFRRMKRRLLKCLKEYYN